MVSFNFSSWYDYMWIKGGFLSMMQCYCYVCETPAPCTHWMGSLHSHCDASDRQTMWKDLRSCHRKAEVKSNSPNWIVKGAYWSSWSAALRGVARIISLLFSVKETARAIYVLKSVMARYIRMMQHCFGYCCICPVNGSMYPRNVYSVRPRISTLR